MNTLKYQYAIPPRVRFLNAFRKLFILTSTDRILAKFSRFGSTKFINKLIPAHYLYRNGTIRKCEVEGLKFMVDIGETNGHSCYFNLPDTGRDVLLATVNEGMNVIDIGANIGIISLKIAQKVSESGNVFSFEPGKINSGFAINNFKLNKSTNIQLIQKGLGSEKATGHLCNVNPINRGMSRILDNDPSANEKEVIEIDTLDNSMEKYSIPAPNLIKIDVEGFELKVLKGACNTLVKHKPILFIELDDNNLHEQNSSAKELVQFLIKLDYKIKNAATGVEINEITNFKGCHLDILCKVS